MLGSEITYENGEQSKGGRLIKNEVSTATEKFILTTEQCQQQFQPLCTGLHASLLIGTQ